MIPLASFPATCGQAAVAKTNEAPTLPRVVVLCCGNPSRGDDALAPMLAERLRYWAPAHVTVVEDFQWQIDTSLELQGHDLALFVDASSTTPAPCTLTALDTPQYTPGKAIAAFTHAMSPQAVLAVCNRLGATPPPAFVLAVRGEQFELGAPLSQDAIRHLDAAWELLQRLLNKPSKEDWLAVSQGKTN